MAKSPAVFKKAETKVPTKGDLERGCFFFLLLLLLLLLLLPFNHQLMETNWRHASLPFDSRMFFSLPKGGVMSLISHTCCIHLVVSLFISKNNSDFLDYRMLECDVIRYMIYGYLE